MARQHFQQQQQNEDNPIQLAKKHIFQLFLVGALENPFSSTWSATNTYLSNYRLWTSKKKITTRLQLMPQIAF